MTLHALPHETGLLPRIAQWWRERAERRESLQALSCMDAHSLGAIAAEFNVTPGQLVDMVEAGAHSADELRELMVLLHINEQAVQQKNLSLMHTLLIDCTNCPAKKACGHDLEAGTALEHYAQYCVNAEVLKTLQKDAALHAH